MSTLAGLSPTFSHRGRAPTRCTPNRGGRQILHHCSGGCGAAALAQVAGFRSSRGPPCVGGHGRQYRQYRQFRQYRQRQWAGRRRLGTRPPTGYVPVAVGRSASNWRFCASSRGGSTSPWAFRRGRRGSDGRSRSRHRRRGIEGLVVVAGPLALTLSRWRPLRDPLVAEGAGRDHPQPPAPDAPVARALSQSLPGGERFGDGPLPRSPLILVAWGAGAREGRPYGEG